MSTRPSAVAGRFYPDDPDELRTMVEQMVLQVGDVATKPRPKAIIAPHAGFVYSGPVAASVYARLRGVRSTIQRIILLGPAHRVAVRGLATSSAGAWATPLGKIELDRPWIERALELSQVTEDDTAHRMEHSLEVHLPFLQVVLGRFRLVPFAVGDASNREIVEVLDLLWGGDETLIVVSSDLSHYYDYQTAKELDRATADAIEALDPSGIGDEQACGRVPVKGLLEAARRRGMRVETVDLRSSGDTAGPRAEVVGYGAWAFV